MIDIHESHDMDYDSTLPEPYCIWCGFGPSDVKKMTAPCPWVHVEE